jgi:hypothetical protein
MIESIEQGRKEDGSRSIADKIKNRLHDLEKTIENNLGRWAWELLQNAKDSISDEAGRDVCVQIELNEDSVIFRHNGAFFTELDIRGLINQISSKEVEDGEQTRNTGRFGTGFLTTHILSRKVKVAGIVKTDDDNFFSFNFLLDREGKTTTELAPKVEMAWKGFQESTQEIDYDENSFNTSFCYLLEANEQKEIANKGIVEFSKLIPYVLTFIPKIKEVKIIGNVTDKSVLFSNTNEVIDGLLSRIEKTEGSEVSNILILHSKTDKVGIAIEVESISNGYSVKNIKDIPKLFCDFPLIGSENFHFPVVVNSFFFNPLTERDGIWLKGSSTDDEVLENQSLLENSVDLYKELVEQVAENNFYGLFNLATTKVPAIDDKYLEQSWYIETIQKPLREFLKQAKIVETNNGKESIGEVYFPDTDFLKEDREQIWQFSSDLKVNKLPIKEHVQKWASVIWSDCSKVDIDDLVKDLGEKKNLSELVKTLGFDEAKAFDWLNDILKFIYEKNTMFFDDYEIVPNQKGDFKASRGLSLDEIEDEKLKEIAKLVGYDFYEELVHKDVFLGHHANKKSIHDIASEITHLINEENNTDKRKLAITMLIQWFENNEEKGKEYFSELYRKKEKLLVDTIEDKESLYSILISPVDISKVAEIVNKYNQTPDEIIENIGKAKELDELLAEYGATNIEELKKLIIATGDTASIVTQEPAPKTEITQEILSSLGVTTLEELEIALKDESISEQFYHTSTPTVEMFRYAQKIIERAKNNILAYLNEHQDYDCSDAEELAPTVIGGIVNKHEQEISIVIRPSDNKQVIIYYDSEIDTLVYENAELWIEDGKSEPRLLTLGKVLKSTRITKIPV